MYKFFSSLLLSFAHSPSVWHLNYFKFLNAVALFTPPHLFVLYERLKLTISDCVSVFVVSNYC